MSAIQLSGPALGIVIGSVAVALLAVVVIIVLAVKLNARNNAGVKAPKVEVKDGVRYSVGDTIETGGKINVTHREGDFTAQKGVTYTAGKKRDLLPGQYTVLTAAEGAGKFNIRLGNGYVREYAHGDTVVLGEGETIVCTSHTVVLR